MMMDDPFLDGPIGADIGSITDAELFKYFLNDEDAGQTPSPYSQVPSNSPSFSDSPPLTPDPIFSEMSDLPFSVKEELNDHFPMLQVPKPALAVGNHIDCLSSNKASKVPKGTDSRRKLESHTLSSEEERHMKRQRRLVKNRESAQLSRMRKKVYIDDLEGKVNVLVSENTSLKEEVLSLQNAIKNISNGNFDVARSAPSTSAGPAPTSGTPTRHVTRNTQAAGVCLLIVLFSLGLLFNATAATSKSDDHSATADHRHRRESAQFPSVGLLGSIPTEKPLSEIIKVENYGEDKPSKEKDVVQKRKTVDSVEGEYEEDVLAIPQRKKIKLEPPSSPPPMSLLTDECNSEEGLLELYSQQMSSAPVAIAVVAPSQHEFGIHPNLEFLSGYRSVNVHVWPMLR